MERYAVKMMQFTPPACGFAWAATPLRRSARPGPDHPGGEAVSEGLFRDFRSVSKAKVFNLYT